MATKVVGVVGMPGSGKSTVAEILKDRYGAMRIHTHDFIKNFLKGRGIREEPENVIMASLYVWLDYGEMPLIDWIQKQIISRKPKFVVLDSLRTMEEARYFRARYGKNFIIFATLSPQKKRHAWLKKRTPKITELELKIRDREELRLGVGDLIANADYYIDTLGTVENGKKQLQAIMKQI
ncbi:MAG: AAA family ATPase [DPANN group archaeon]|nr:AAA family ATPase [DPANN group archaeon]